MILQTGIGPERAYRATEYLLANYPVTHLISSGYCGALEERARTGHAFLASSLKTMDSEDLLESDSTLLSLARSALKQADIPSQEGLLMTSPKAILDTAEKSKVASDSGAKAVDMESFFIHRAVQEKDQKIASLTVRFVVDGLQDPLTDTEGILDAEARLKPLGLMRETIRRPKILMELPGLGKKAGIARRSMSRFLKTLFISESSMK